MTGARGGGGGGPGDAGHGTIVPLAERIPKIGATGAATGWIRPQSSGAVRPFLQSPAAAVAQPSPVAAPPIAPPAQPLSVEEIRAAAEREGIRAGSARIEAVVGRYLEAIEQHAARAREAATPAAADVVALALVVAREILGREVAADRRLMEAAIEEALRSARRGSPVIVRLGRSEFEQAKRRQAVLAESGVEVLLDEKLGPGGGVVEAPDRITDHSVDARLEAVRAAVIEALQSPSRDPHRGPPRPGEDGRA